MKVTPTDDDLPPYTPPQNAPSGDKPPPRCTCPQRGTPQTSPQIETTPNEPRAGPGGENTAKKVIGAVLIAAAVPTLLVTGAALVLPAIGFGAGGVIGGSLAAGAQSIFYGGATGGLFSILQSAGATIAAPAAAEVIAAAGSVMAGASMFKKDGRGDEEGDENAEEQGDHPQEPIVCDCVSCECNVDCNCECRRRARGTQT